MTPHSARARDELTSAVQTLMSASVSDKDLRMATHAIRDLTAALSVLSPYQYQYKATIFGSARLTPGTSGYDTAYRTAQLLASKDFVVITGGGPGVMHAGLAGAGKGRGVGIAIELPFEAATPEQEKQNGWPLARQQMFFTRKLALVRNIHAFIAAPGGFGTLDEVFEVITLLQTGKAKPAPVVLLETPENPMWSRLQQFIQDHLIESGMVDPHDPTLYAITSDPVEAVEHITRFWSNYRGISFHGDDAILHMDRLPDAHAQQLISQQRGVTGPVHIDHESPSLRFEFNKRHWSNMRSIIDIVNEAA